MRASLKRFLSIPTAMIVFIVSVQTSLAADDHVVPLRELERQVRQTAEQRSTNIADITRVLSHPAAARELARYNVAPRQVQAAVATLSDSELSRLADRARSSEKDVEGGLIVGILALIGLIVVIIVVLSVVAQAGPPAAEIYASAGHGTIQRAPAISEVAPVYS